MFGHSGGQTGSLTIPGIWKMIFNLGQHYVQRVFGNYMMDLRHPLTSKIVIWTWT